MENEVLLITINFVILGVIFFWYEYQIKNINEDLRNLIKIAMVSIDLDKNFDKRLKELEDKK